MVEGVVLLCEVLAKWPKVTTDTKKKQKNINGISGPVSWKSWFSKKQPKTIERPFFGVFLLLFLRK